MTHRLMLLVEKAGLALSEEQSELLEAVTDFNLEARYPDEKFLFGDNARGIHRKLPEEDRRVAAMVAQASKIVKTIRLYLDELGNSGIPVSEAFLFGSFATGKRGRRAISTSL